MTDSRIDADTDAAIDACQRQFSADLNPDQVIFGFDGVIDYVRQFVDQRHDATSFSSITKLEELGDRINQSVHSQSSISLEWTQKGVRCGGHVSHLSRFFGTVGYSPTMLGTFGTPPRQEFSDEFSDYEMVSLGSPGYTHAVEFNDGKCLINEPGDYIGFDWDTILQRITLEELASRLDRKPLFGIGYWFSIPKLPSILEGMAKDLWPVLSDPPENVLLDLGDVRQIPSERLIDGLEAINHLERVTNVTVSLNRVETFALANALADFEDGRSLLDASICVQEELEVSRFLGHNAAQSVAITNDQISHVKVAQVDDPKLTTSAGDHFNGGFMLGLLEGMDDHAALALGNSVAGLFIRNGTPPKPEAIKSFVESYGRQAEI